MVKGLWDKHCLCNLEQKKTPERIHAIFLPRDILFFHFCPFTVVWGLGFLGWGLELSFWGWGFQLMGFGVCVVGSSGFFWGITLGKQTLRTRWENKLWKRMHITDLLMLRLILLPAFIMVCWASWCFIWAVVIPLISWMTSPTFSPDCSAILLGFTWNLAIIKVHVLYYNYVHNFLRFVSVFNKILNFFLFFCNTTPLLTIMVSEI
mgnify:CR=1 FL=1